LDDSIALGNLDSARDWGYAPDYVEAMWMMLQHDEPVDYVVSTGVARTIRDFLTAAFGHAGITDWERYVTIDPKYFRPAEVDVLRGDSSKIESDIGWKPKTKFEDWVGRMVQRDVYLNNANKKGHF
jgi:GDPmannose 4,6-dehydratase